MKTKKLVIAVLSFLLLSGILITAVTAKTWPSLPNKAVTLEITNLTPWTFPFVIALSGVPGGFDVSDGLYTGWCVDVTHFIERGVEYQVNLYSSLSPPAEVSSVQWDMINYILNHKDAGTGDDIQDALWYFINGGAYFTSWGKPHTTSATTEAIVADAIANGAGYTPGTGDTVAIICLPTGTPEERAQMLIIELQAPAPGTGKVTGGGQCIVGDNKKIPSASFGFNAMWFSRDPTPKGEINYVDHITGMHVHVHDLTYLEVWQDEPGNKPWPMMKAKFGGPCTVDGVAGHFADVYVEDHGEPGKNDVFYIKLDGVYLGGSLVDPILAGNIQIHKPPK